MTWIRGETQRVLFSALVLGCVVLTACGSEPVTPEATPVAVTGTALDEHRTLGEPLTIENLTVWPIYTDAPRDMGAYLTLHEAQEQGVAEVREAGGASGAQQVDINDLIEQEIVLEPVPEEGAPDPAPPPQEEGDVIEEVDGQPVRQEDGDVIESVNGQPVPPGQVRAGQGPAQQIEVVFDEEGQIVVEGSIITAVVNTLVIENKGDTPILVCAGTLVTGGQQDRQIGQDFVIAAGETVPVDAYCVEPSRWHAREGQDGAVFHIVENIAIHGARSGGQYEGDQGKVWEAVRETLANAEVDSSTQTLMDALENGSDELKSRGERFEAAVRAHFDALALAETPPVGFAYAIDGQPVTVRSFAHARVLKGQLPAFVRVMSFEAALAAAAGDREAFETPTAEAVVAMVERIEAEREEVRETAALNFNGYKEATIGFGSSCYVPIESSETTAEGTTTELVPLSQDWTARRK